MDTGRSFRQRHGQGTPGEPKGTMPLAMAAVGQQLKLVSLHGGREFQHRLAEMGLIPGVQFRVLAKGQPGPFIILLKETRLMLGYGMIHRVFVCPAD